jgi:hypothetical protein
MYPRINFYLSVILCLVIFLTACGSQPTETPTVTPSISATPDLCGPEAIKAEIDKVNHLMREFDDAAAIAGNTGRDNLQGPIAELQRIRRAAEDLQVPPCLSDLKQIQLAHMNLVIATLIAHMGNSAEPQSITDAINRARQLHDLYTLEIARLLGITLVPVTAPAQPSQTAVAGAPTQEGVFISNPGPTTVNMRAAPALDALNLGLLEVGLSARVIGRSADNQWLLIEVPGQPGQTAWVFTSLVTLSASPDALPIVTPAP